MNSDAVISSYEELRGQYNAGTINLEQFTAKVGKLVAVAPDGSRWKIDSTSGSWVAENQVIPERAQSEEPETLIRFFKLALKSAISGLPKMILVALIFALLTWSYHTYLVAVVNDGLMLVSSSFALNSIIHLQESHFSGINAFWGVLAYFARSLLGRIFRTGVRPVLAETIQFPSRLKGSFQSFGSGSPGIICLGAFAALLIASLCGNFMLSWILAIGLLFILTMPGQSIEIKAVRLGISDLSRVMKRPLLAQGREQEAVYLGFAGAAGGFLFAALLRTNFTLAFFISLLFLAGFVLLRFLPPKTVLPSLLAVSSILLLHDQTVLAYCEGGSFSQAGGNWFDWWSSNNADIVRQKGVAPGFSASLGALLGGIAAAGNSVLQDLGPVSTPPPARQSAYPEAVQQTFTNTATTNNEPSRMVDENGKEYIWYKPKGDTADGPFWCPVELYEQDKWHENQRHVFQDGQWHPDQEIANLVSHRRENPPETWYRPEEEIKKMREANREERINDFVRTARENPHALGDLHKSLNDEEFAMAQERLTDYKKMLENRRDIYHDLSDALQAEIDHSGRWALYSTVVDKVAEKTVSTLSTKLNFGKPYGVGTLIEFPYRAIRNYGTKAAEDGVYWIGWQETGREIARSAYQTGTNAISKDDWSIASNIASAGVENIGEQLIIDQKFEFNKLCQEMLKATLGEAAGALAGKATSLFTYIDIDSGLTYIGDDMGNIYARMVLITSEEAAQMATIPVTSIGDILIENALE